MVLVNNITEGRCCFDVKPGEACCKAQSPEVRKDDNYYPANFFTCTRPHGHKGMHVACGLVDHALMAWEYEEDR